MKQFRPKGESNKEKTSYISHIDWEKAEKLFAKDKILFSKIRNDKGKIYPAANEILKILAAGAVIGLSFAFPALSVAIAPFFIDGHKYQYHRLTQTVSRLRKQKMVTVSHKNGMILVKISQNGRVKALEYKLSELVITKPKKWDRKWRMVIFDIPEKYKRMRNIFRKRLIMLGFYKLQESVWVHPYPCFNEVEFLKQIYNVGVNVRYIIADKIEDADDLLEYFKIKS